MIDLDGLGARDTVALLRELYCDRARTVTSILHETGLSKRRLYAVARREGWPPRARGRASAPEAPSADEARRARASAPGPAKDMGPVDRRAMATRLERFIAGRIVDIERDPGPADAERQARTLNQLTRTATAIRTYLDTLTEETSDDADAHPPRSLSALRDELRRHLERIRDEEFSRAVR